MNSKFILFLSLFAAVALAASGISAAPRGGGRAGSMPMGGGHTFVRGGAGTWGGHNWSGRNWSGRNWSGSNWRGRNWSGNNWHGGNWGGNWHHHHHHNDVIFIGDFGFPWWWGWGWGPSWGWGWGYPYGYYGYGYPYGYGYGGDQYGDYGYGSRYGDTSRSRVAELQRRLARAGYYRGAIDGILGPQTRRAIRAYERDHNVG
jgi:Putative peptidoglycan binding domain